jgi:ribosome-binding factor A
VGSTTCEIANTGQWDDLGTPIIFRHFTRFFSEWGTEPAAIATKSRIIVFRVTGLKATTMSTKRQLQVGREIQKELGDLFMKNGPSWYGQAFVTITGVKLTPDLLTARVHLSVMNEKDKQHTVDLLSAQAKEIRYQLGNRMRHQLRRIPELEFFLDDSLDQVYHLENVFKKLRDQDGNPEDTD